MVRVVPKTNMKLASLDVDEFMKRGLDTDSDSDSESDGFNTETDKKLDDVNEMSASSHKKSLQRLRKSDPDFYEFLKQEEQSLLEFSDDGYGEEDTAEKSSDSVHKNVQNIKSLQKKRKHEETILGESDKNDRRPLTKQQELDFILESETDSDENEEYHRLPVQLQVASDSEDEKDTDEQKGVCVTKQMIKTWTSLMREGSTSALKQVFHAFRSAAQQTSGTTITSKYKLDGSSIFNAVIRMCLAEIPQTLHNILHLPQLTDFEKPPVPSKDNKKWKILRIDVKYYLKDLLQLMSGVAEFSMINILLKHLHKLLVFCTTFTSLSKIVLKKLIQLWSRGDESTRVVAFLCINRLARLMQRELLELCMKQMYMSYVKNSKFTSPTTLPLINFMQHSIVEIYVIDQVTAYQYSFIYIRQLAIHLRNAITVKKKENSQAVYNWQFIHCIGLWTRLLSANPYSEILRPLIYPLTQTIIGTLKLVPTSRYYPLRFHCVRYLNQLSKSTDTFIPVLPFLLEIFEQEDFNKKHKSISFKPLNFACMLKLSNAQLLEKAFKDGIIDQLYELLLEQFNTHSHSIGFPELALPAVFQIKDFLKKCKIANYCKQMKQILDKVEESSKFIISRRKSTNIQLADLKAVKSWEELCRQSGTPLGKYYGTWRKLRDRELQHEIAGKERLVGSENLPLIERSHKLQKATDEDKKEFSALFDSDSDDGEDDQTRFLLKGERKKNREPALKKKKMSKNQDSESDYSDFDSDELEQLAGSADEGSEIDESSTAPSIEEEAGEDRDKDTGSELSDKDDIVEDFRMSSDSE